MARKASGKGKDKATLRTDAGKLIKGVRLLKDKATGKTWRRLHRIESELGTVAGSKTAEKKPAKKSGKK